MNHETILESSSGLFGPISIRETSHASIRLMKINNEIEGQVFTSPDSAKFHCKVHGPGAVSASRYLYGFIIPAWQFSKARGLILGLGAGAGVAMLLALFPQLSLMVVEIDSEVIRLARRNFPLIQFYEDQGRLDIVQSDAEAYLDYCQDSFAFTLLDLFAGDESSSHNASLIDKTLKISPCFMANMITSQSMHSTFQRSLYLQKQPFLMWLSASSTIRPTENVNWMLINMHSLSPEIQDYQLFDSSLQAHPNVITANQYFRYILSQVEAACFYR